MDRTEAIPLRLSRRAWVYSNLLIIVGGVCVVLVGLDAVLIGPSSIERVAANAIIVMTIWTVIFTLIALTLGAIRRRKLTDEVIVIILKWAFFLAALGVSAKSWGTLWFFLGGK